jgi:hypothetical protein
MGGNTNGADLKGCAVVITLYNPYIMKLRVNGHVSVNISASESTRCTNKGKKA